MDRGRMPDAGGRGSEEGRCSADRAARSASAHRARWSPPCRVHRRGIRRGSVQATAAPGRLPAHHRRGVGRIRPGDGGMASGEKAAAMTVSPVYQPRSIKRTRSTQAEVAARREALLDIIAAGRPMTVRQVFYQATVRGLVEKAESGYGKVKTDLIIMRRAGELPYDWLADNTRWQRKPRTFNGVEEALKATAAFYRKSLWTDADAYVEIWLEKDALAGVVYPVTSMYDVPLMVARGYASLSFLHSAAEAINDLDVPAYIYHFGDFDPSGVNAGEKIEETLRELAPDAEIEFERIAVTPQQIADW